MGEWILSDLVASEGGAGARPAEGAYSAMTELLARRFLWVTGSERSWQVHRGAACRECDACWDITYKHVQWATDKLAKHYRGGPPTTRGEPVRDWQTILRWVREPGLADTPVGDVRDALRRRLAPADPLLPLVLSIGTQLLPATNDARTPRKMRDYVSGYLRSVRAQEQGWEVRPGRDLIKKVTFARVRADHPRGCELLVEILALLDRGQVDPYAVVLASSEDPEGDGAALRQLIAALLGDPATQDWFLRNVEARRSFNVDEIRRTYGGALADGFGRDDEED